MSQSRSLILRRAPADLLEAPISAFESETQAVIQRTAPYSEHAILHVLTAMVVLALVAMWFVKLDRVVTGSGRILPMQGSYFVQPIDRAIVGAILVRPGDVVRKGQVLAKLDPTFSRADLTQLEQKKAAGEALVARLQAEQAGKTYVATPGSPESAQEAAIWGQRNAEYRQSLNDFDARIRSGGEAVRRFSQNASDYGQRETLASQAEDTQQKLMKMGYGRESALLAASDNRVEMQRMTAENQNDSVQAQHDLQALSAQRAVFVSHWQDDVSTRLVAAQNELNETLQNLTKASKISDLSTVTAPADAVVLKIGKASNGSVVDPSSTAAEPLFTLTPLNGPLEAELRIPAGDIGFIRKGDTVRLKLDAYRFTSHGAAKGIIETISDGSFTASDDGQVVAPYYKARVKIIDAQLRNVPAGFHLIPGLTGVGEIMVGHRSIMAYLFEGAVRTGSEAMREP